jgi:hypothetical protein
MGKRTRLKAVLNFLAQSRKFTALRGMEVPPYEGWKYRLTRDGLPPYEGWLAIASVGNKGLALLLLLRTKTTKTTTDGELLQFFRGWETR